MVYTFPSSLGFAMEGSTTLYDEKELEGLHWSSPAPGHFERALDTLEQLYVTNCTPTEPGGREHVPVSICVRLETSLEDLPSRLVQAWKMLRYECPSMAAVVEDGKKVYHAPDAAEVQEWLARTFITIGNAWADHSFSDLQTVYEATLFYFASTFEVLIRAPHYTLDGIGAMMAMDTFLTFLADPKPVTFGAEAANLTPPLALAIKVSPPTALQLASTEAALQTWKDSHPSINLPLTGHRRPHGLPRRLVHVFDPPTSAALLAACKARDLTITHAVQAAFVLATAQRSPFSDLPVSDANEPAPSSSPASPPNPRPHTAYSAYSVFNVRPHCASPFDAAQHAFAAYHAPSLLSVPVGSFAETVAGLREHYDATKGDAAALLCGLERGIRRLPQLAPRGGEVVGNPACVPFMSSLGVAERFVRREYGGGDGDGGGGGGTKVVGLWRATEPRNKGVVVHLWSWMDRVTVSVSFNEGFHSVESMRSFLGATEDILLREMAVEVVREE